MSGKTDVITITVKGPKYVRQEIVDAIHELLFEDEELDDLGFSGTNASVEVSSTLEPTPQGEGITNKKVCTTCHGEGEVKTSWNNDSMVECEDCDGKGVVEDELENED